MHTSGARALWLSAVANKIMDGGANPPSIDLLMLQIPTSIATAINDGHVTAANAFGEKRRNDYKAGQRVIIEEMVEVLRAAGFVNGNEKALRWTKPPDGIWTVTIGDLQYTLRGQHERRLSSEVHMLGERSDFDTEPDKDGMFLSGKSRPFELNVVGARGGVTRHAYQVHPLALAIPPMTQKERETLRKSIEDNGVLQPLLIYQDKILDGRNRGFYASILDKPVRIQIFEGSEEQARMRVAVLNLHRRHLNAAQRSLATVRLFGEGAQKETAEALERSRLAGNQNRSPAPLKTAEPRSPDRSREWPSIAAREANKAGLSVTPSAVRAMGVVNAAPITASKVERGEITIVKEAYREARKELGQEPTTTIVGVNPQSIRARLGQCIGHLNAILKDCSMAPGIVPEELGARLRKIRDLSEKVETTLRDRKIIS